MRWTLLAAAAMIAAASLVTRAHDRAPRGHATGQPVGPATRVDLPTPAPESGIARAGPMTSAGPLDALHGALDARDAEALARVGDNLAAWLGGDEARALLLVEGLRAEADLVGIDLIAMTLASDTAAVRWALVAREMLAVARGDSSADRRRAALLYLARSGAKSADVESVGLWLAQSDPDLLVRAAAFDLLGALAASDPSAAGRLHPALVLQAARGSDPALRIAALQAIDPAKASEETLRTIREIGVTDVDADVRLEAAARARP